MSDEGEKTCPLCAEEMDLTDLQLKACKCGYEICVWCWHHLMDMAEKDDVEGRCPACRVSYDKEKIVGMAANCERLVTEINSGKKTKLQKSKPKPSEGRKQLSSVRVIQRNLVYIVGLPLDLADEDLLQHREYFGQYGKVLKVSISRTASGVIQQFPNNTCSVYITYSREEEAVRCIQYVHEFTLEGSPLRACFGTTKYCHAWLRNMPCSNPDCMYLHEIGSQEDSFTKDEIISAYTRNRVQQIMGPTSNRQQRSGNVLPPPEDDYCNNIVSFGKPIVKIPPNITTNSIGGSPPNGSSCRSTVVLPAAASWGTRSSNCQAPASSLPFLSGPSKHTPGADNGTSAFSSAVTNTNQASQLYSNVRTKSLNEESNTLHAEVKTDSMKSLRPHIGIESRSTDSDKYASLNSVPPGKSLSSQISYPPVLSENDRGITMPGGMQFSNGNGRTLVYSVIEKEGKISSEGRVQNLISDMSALSIDGHAKDEDTAVIRPNNSVPDNHRSQQFNANQLRESLSSPVAGKSASLIDKLHSSASKTKTAHTISEIEEDILSFDNQRLKDPEVASHLNYMPNSIHVSNHSRSCSLHHNVDNKVSDDSVLRQRGTPNLSNGYHENLGFRLAGFDRGLDASFLVQNQDERKQMQRSHVPANDDSSSAISAGESSIISDILSMDFGAWNDSLTSPNLSKLLGDTDTQSGSVRTNSRKTQSSNQSRFSFARQEESPFSVNEQFPENRYFDHSFSENGNINLDKIGISDGFSASSSEEFDSFTGSHASISSNKHSVSRAQISTPPGFSIPSRAPPPGFSSQERTEQAFDTTGDHLLESSSLLRNTFQAPPTCNNDGYSDIEFMDPAILAVGKGRFQDGLNCPDLDMRHNFPPQMSTLGNERLQWLMQRSISQHQNAGFYATSSRLIDYSQVNGHSHFGPLSIPQSRNGLMSNGHWDGWNEVQGGNSLAMAELLRNERLGLNKFYYGYEDAKLHAASSFGM